MQQQNVAIEKVLKKIKHYCAYQERSHAEVRNKLYSLGMFKNNVEMIIAQLIAENFLNEERYAIAFASGKFNINHWGRLKIRQALKQNKVSDYCVKEALLKIDQEEYILALKKLWKTKENILKDEKNNVVKKQKLFSYLLQKGFEQDLIYRISKEFETGIDFEH